MTPQEFKSLCDFVAEHEANIPRYHAAKQRLDEVWEEHQRLAQTAAQERAQARKSHKHVK
jgi:hypothetical protein